MLLGTISDLNVRATRAEIVGLSVQSRPQASHDEHAALLAPCRDRDGARAVRLLTEHLSKARATALDAITR
ncbi:MAG: FCD domain-containing protein [Verrucomicrobia bacterium]|nr:FCD domain-containing protein [Verrucomicrobiota bacterium]